MKNNVQKLFDAIASDVLSLDEASLDLELRALGLDPGLEAKRTKELILEVLEKRSSPGSSNVQDEDHIHRPS